MKKLAAIVAFTFCLPVSVPAAIVDNGTYFQDTVTGLYWLKLTESRGLSYNNVEDQLGYGENFAGWRFATLQEVEALISTLGIAPQGNTCATASAYCDTIPAGQQENHEDIIRLFGDTQDPYLDETAAAKDISPDGTGKAIGTVADEYSDNHIWYLTLQDREFVNRSDGTPLIDRADTIFADHINKSWGIGDRGSFLVRTTDPGIPLGDPLDPNTTEVTLLNQLDPLDIGITFWCPAAPDPPYSYPFCGWDEEDFELWYVLTYWGEWITTPYITLAVFTGGEYDASDWQLRPWVRVNGYDYSGTCDSGDAALGDGWCRKTIAAPEWVLGPDSSGIAPMVSLPPTLLDNIELEFVPQNIVTDFDPWNDANTARPKNAYWITMEIKTTSIGDGDAYDFDASTVDPASLRVGPDQAHFAANNVLQADRDNDGDTDYIFGFKMEETGISCLDTQIAIAGKTFAGEPFHGNDTITPIECEEVVNIDVDPFNATNTIRPNDNYNVTVAILGSRTSLGDASDLYPGSGGDDDVNVGSLKFGPAETGNTATPVITDINTDSLDDILVSFNAYDAGIACGDTELNMTGEKVSGIPIEATDSIVTEDCDTGCHP